MSWKIKILFCACAVVYFSAAGAKSLALEQIETSGFSAGAGFSTGPGIKLESVIGETAVGIMTQSLNRILHGHANTGHSPGTVSTITVVTGSGEGEILVSWTAAGRDGTQGQADSFDIRVATFVLNASSFHLASMSVIVSAWPPGLVQNQVISGLPPGFVYHVAMITRDSANMSGRVSVEKTTSTFAVYPGSVTNLSAVSDIGGGIRLSWNVTGDDGYSGDLNPGIFRIDYSTDPGHVFSSETFVVQISTVASENSPQNIQITGLYGNTTYYAKIYIGDDIPVFSSTSNIASVLTRANPPAAGVFSNVNTSSFTISFQADNSYGTEYMLEISTSALFGSISALSGWITSLSADFSSLLPRATYYVRGRARDLNMVETSTVTLGSVPLPPVTGSYDPGAPAPQGFFSGASTFMLSWQPVTLDSIGNAANIREYRIYRSTGIFAPGEYVAVVSSSSQLVYTEDVPAGSSRWFFVRALDVNNNTGPESLWIKASAAGGAVSVSPDRKAYADISRDVSSALAQAGSVFVWTHVTAEETAGVVSSYRWNMLDSRGKLMANVILPDHAGIVLPIPGGGGGPQVSAAFGPSDYAIFHDNGVEYIKLGGDVNPASEGGTISVQTRRMGNFQVRRILRATSFSVTQTEPIKIFTPNGDLINDEFTIFFENPAALAISGARVYSLNGAEIGDLKTGAVISATSGSLVWDGRDKGGRIARTGIYIYQFRAGNKVYNGTVVLAK